MTIQHVTDDTFHDEVLASTTPTVVDFWAPWCGPCRDVGTVLDELSDELADKVKIAKVNIDSDAEVAVSLGVRSIPALFFFKDGEAVSNRLGSAPKSELKRWIDGNL